MLDEKALFERKGKFLGYRFCPRCSGDLNMEMIDGRDRLRCLNDKCDFIYYHNPIPAAGAIVVEEGKILLVKRAVMPRVGWWCIPAGFMEWSEHPSQTAVREVQEETGLEIRLESLFEVYSGNDDPRMNAVLILYLGRKIGGRLAPADDAQDVRFFGFDELPEKIAFISHHQALADYRERFLK
ncbi:MAG: NUDIX hydrolase [candidate division Zixibacteria bacterium HGW-Zixibacteria-1]|nr:MAG: NUDIX hydrolase [candidate division Zixibacteria bacterium HGW-Zixibacteria-1]